MTVEANQLVGKWVHAHEEDKGDTRVFRPVNYVLPPSRGRRSLDLRGDGTAIESGPGPDDRAREQPSRWALHGGDVLTLASGGKTQKLRVLAASPEKLVVADA